MLSRGIPNDQLGTEENLAVWELGIFNFFHKDRTGLLAHLEAGLGNGGDGRECHPGSFNIVKTNDGKFFRNPDAQMLGSIDGGGGKHIGASEESIRMGIAIQRLQYGGVCQRIVNGWNTDIPFRIKAETTLFQGFQVAIPAVAGIFVFLTAVDKADFLAAQGDKIVYCTIGGGNVINADIGAGLILRIFTAHNDRTVIFNDGEQFSGRCGAEPQHSAEMPLLTGSDNSLEWDSYPLSAREMLQNGCPGRSVGCRQ